MGIVLGDNRYGKAEIRMVHVARSGAHELADLNVSVALAGDLAGTHLRGDNSNVLPTDTQKNTVYAFAAERGVGEIEDFALRLARHFVSSQPAIARAWVAIEEYPWRRLGPHSFARDGGSVRTARAVVDGDSEWVLSGVRELVLMNTTNSEFHGYVVDRYTTLPPTTDRILATEVSAAWRHGGTTVDFGQSYVDAVARMTDAFVGTYSLALQQTLYAMGGAVLADAGIVEARLVLPNKHHFLVDTAPFGLDNPAAVYHADDRPYGRIEGTVTREDTVDAPLAWDGYAL
ncbi:uricase [Virgisporangium aliadipatigenens]|uniref:Uricase n=1 Tax=Virgisporangium aliadipatigenens TaxID=741659 RepID=A0A8J4DRJ4_9ACTN|nr:urate oxidase [Virgisporangium aliadipatigenens]GIJ46392.1 uricase [Virgisporangium aliadipatigenens]